MTTQREDKYLIELVTAPSFNANAFLLYWDPNEADPTKATKKLPVRLLPAGQGERNVQGDLLETDPNSAHFILHKDRFRVGDGTVSPGALDAGDEAAMMAFAAALGIAWPVTSTQVTDVNEHESGGILVTLRDGTERVVNVQGTGVPVTPTVHIDLTYGKVLAGTTTIDSPATVRAGVGQRVQVPFPVAAIGDSYAIELPDGYELTHLYSPSSGIDNIIGFTRVGQRWQSAVLARAVPAHILEAVVESE